MPGNVSKMRKGLLDQPTSLDRVSTGGTAYSREKGSQISLGKNPAGSGSKGSVSKQGNQPKV